jgi:hypothetical protein
MSENPVVYNPNTTPPLHSDKPAVRRSGPVDAYDLRVPRSHAEIPKRDVVAAVLHVANGPKGITDGSVKSPAVTHHIITKPEPATTGVTAHPNGAPMSNQNPT